MKTTKDNITTEQIEALRTEAGAAGDQETVRVCEEALEWAQIAAEAIEGASNAIEECATIIANAQAQAQAQSDENTEYSVQIIHDEGCRWQDTPGQTPEEAGRRALKDAADHGWAPATANVYPLGTSVRFYEPIASIQSDADDLDKPIPYVLTDPPEHVEFMAPSDRSSRKDY